MPAGQPLAELVPERRWVSWVEPSRFIAGRAYLVLDGHRSDDDRPHVLATEDFGATWLSIRSNLPDGAGTTRVLREDPVNSELLYLGTEFGAWFSLDRGLTWTSLNSNLPTVAVHAFALHSTAGEIVAATHGRSLWVLDVTTLRQLTKEALAAEVHLFTPATAILWRPEPSRGRARSFVGINPTAGAVIFYSLAKKTDPVTILIRSRGGKTVRELEASPEPGLHRVVWDLRHPRPEGRRSRRRQGPIVRPDRYEVVLTAGKTEVVRELAVAIDPDHPDGGWIAGQEAAEELDAEYREAKEKRRMPWLFRDAD